MTVLGLLLGRRVFNLYGWANYRGGRSFDRIEERLATLGLGLLLHDIGKLIVPATVLNKPGSLDAEEWELIRAHPVAGIELLPGEAISPLAKSVVRSHHERWDGAGYPDNRTGGKISQLARIASVADVYDAITSERPYRDARPAHVGHAAIIEGSGTQFDPEVVAAFRKVVAPYPVGSEITLADGSRGIVASVSQRRPGAAGRPGHARSAGRAGRPGRDHARRARRRRRAGGLRARLGGQQGEPDGERVQAHVDAHARVHGAGAHAQQAEQEPGECDGDEQHGEAVGKGEEDGRRGRAKRPSVAKPRPRKTSSSAAGATSTSPTSAIASTTHWCVLRGSWVGAMPWRWLACRNGSSTTFATTTSTSAARPQLECRAQRRAPQRQRRADGPPRRPGGEEHVDDQDEVHRHRADDRRGVVDGVLRRRPAREQTAHEVGDEEQSRRQHPPG